MAGCSKHTSSYCVKEHSSEETQVLARELMMAFRTIKHHEYFSAADSTGKLVLVLFADFNVTRKFSCARTKSTVLIKHVVSPHCFEKTVNKLKDANYF